MRRGILVIGGAFNPVHIGHVDMLTRLKSELEENGEWKILGGYFAVAPEGYVREKMSKRNERAIRVEHRLNLVRIAIRDKTWLEQSPFQDEALRRAEGSAFSLGERLKRFFNDDSIEILIVVGADRFVKHSIPIWRKTSTSMRVAIPRDSINLDQLWEKDFRLNLIPNPEKFFISKIESLHVSSTQIRSKLESWFNESNDETSSEREQFIDPNVFLYIKQRWNEIFI